MHTGRSVIIFCKAVFFFVVDLSSAVEAQICNGSLGDAVVNVNFGAGTGTGSPLPGATTTYSFVSGDCPDDGSYTVIAATNACFGNSWHTLSQDHTLNDLNGQMMLVNASFNPGDFYVDTVRGLCANTTYEFSAWVVNVLLPGSCNSSGIDPNLVFNIETVTGQVLGTYSTGNITETSSPQWNQYGLFFTTPLNTSNVVIRITNNAPGGCGNDLALDNITFRPCGPVISAVVNASQTATDLCKSTVPATVALSATIGNGYLLPAVQWQESLDNGIAWTDIPGAVTNNYLFGKSAVGTYLYRLTAAEGTNIVLSNCRVASNIVTITIHDLPAVTANGSSTVCENTTVKLTAGGAATYAWTGSAGFTSTLPEPSFVVAANGTGQYTVVGTDMFGCTNTAAAMIAVFPNPVAVVSGDQNICKGDAVRLAASGGDTYEWSPAAGLSAVNIADPSAMPELTTLYTVAVTNGNACTDTATVKLTVWQKPTASAGEDKVVLENVPVVLDGSAGGSEISYYWTPVNFLNDPLLLQPTCAATQDTSYTLHVLSNVGCGVFTDVVFVKVFSELYIPNAFTPNNDGKNDTWRIKAMLAFPEAAVSVYNRFGQKIFEGSGGNVFWDGTFKRQLQDPGTYMYLVDFKNDRPVKKGWVLLIR